MSVWNLNNQIAFDKLQDKIQSSEGPMLWHSTRQVIILYRNPVQHTVQHVVKRRLSSTWWMGHLLQLKEFCATGYWISHLVPSVSLLPIPPKKNLLPSNGTEGGSMAIASCLRGEVLVLLAKLSKFHQHLHSRQLLSISNGALSPTVLTTKRNPRTRWAWNSRSELNPITSDNLRTSHNPSPHGWAAFHGIAPSLHRSLLALKSC